MTQKDFPHKKTKIVATIGPATESVEMLTKLTGAGLDVARLNMSHGDHTEHAARITNVRKVSQTTGKHLAVLLDLSGPKIRIGEFETERITLVEGQKFTLTTEKITGTQDRVYVNYPTLPQELSKGSFVLLDDGKKKLEVLKTTDTEVICRVIVGGDTKGRRGVNLPGAYLKISSITPKDKKDLAFGLEHGVDFVALSFVREARDIDELRKMLVKAKSGAKIVAKIETQEAIDTIDEILEKTDAVMVARGDLAIEIGAENVPSVQKMIIAKSRALGKPVIVATQMLESMISSPVPTRAEVSDIANAIYDGADAIMLSEETTLGKYPIEAVSVMSRVAQKTEDDLGDEFALPVFENVVDVVTSSVVDAAHALVAKGIVALTESGSTARSIARHRALCPLYVFAGSDAVARQLSLSYGCFPIVAGPMHDFEKALRIVSSTLKKESVVKKGDTVVVSFGMPSGVVGSTNTMHVLTIE